MGRYVTSRSLSFYLLNLLSFPLAYYNAGSAAVAFGLIFIGIGTFFWCRARRRRSSNTFVSLPTQGNYEESIPLASGDELRMRNVTNGGVNGKGKERAVAEGNGGLGEPIFDVGEHSDDEDGGERYRDRPAV